MSHPRPVANKAKGTEVPGRLVFVFGHTNIRVKLFSGLAKRDKNNIVDGKIITNDQGSEIALKEMLETIRNTIEEQLKNKDPDIYEMVVIVEGNAGNTGKAISPITELLRRIQDEFNFKFAKNENELEKTFNDNHVPLLLFILGTGNARVESFKEKYEENLSCEEAGKKFNSTLFPTEANLGKHISRASLAEVMRILGGSPVSPLHLSLLSPRSGKGAFSSTSPVSLNLNSTNSSLPSMGSPMGSPSSLGSPVSSEEGAPKPTLHINVNASPKESVEIDSVQLEMNDPEEDLEERHYAQSPLPQVKSGAKFSFMPPPDNAGKKVQKDSQSPGNEEKIPHGPGKKA
jgi:hypothetical protein